MKVLGRVGADLLAAAASRVLLFCPLQLLYKLLLLLLKTGCLRIKGTKDYIQKHKFVTKAAGFDTLRGREGPR